MEIACFDELNNISSMNHQLALQRNQLLRWVSSWQNPF